MRRRPHWELLNLDRTVRRKSHFDVPRRIFASLPSGSQRMQRGLVDGSYKVEKLIAGQENFDKDVKDWERTLGLESAPQGRVCSPGC